MEPTLSFSGQRLTAREKVRALVSFGLADDTDEAVAMLVDMGEVSEGDPSLYQDDSEPDEDDDEDERWMHDRSSDPDYSERDEDEPGPDEIQPPTPAMDARSGQAGGVR